MSAVLGIDIGGTRLRLASGDGELASGPAPTSAAELAERVAATAAAMPSPPVGVGVAVPGLVEGTRCRWVPNLPFLDGVDLADLLRDAGAPVVAGNDAQLALLAESTIGAAAGARDAMLLSVGTGIGSAVLCEGRIVRGARGGACSFGWATADVDDAGDMRSGWLERRASGRALDAIGARLDPPRDGPGAIAAARAGDVAAWAALASAAEALGTVLAGAVALLDPEVVLVAGGVADALDVLGPLVAGAMAPRLPAHLREVPIRAAALGGGASLAGALLAARRDDWWTVRA